MPDTPPAPSGDPADKPALDRTTTQLSGISISEDKDTEKKERDHRPRDSKGWDGKLRLPKKGCLDGEEGPSGSTPASPRARVVTEEGPAPDTLEADEDLLDDVPEDEEDIDLVHCRVESIPALRLERFKKLKRLCLRQNHIEHVEIPAELAPTLEEIDLYDNLISHIRGFDAFTNLTTLDLSFNKIKHIKRLSHLSKLRDLYFVQNKISTIEGLDGLSELRNLELGANRIREITNLDSLTSLEQLWLGKNKITSLTGLPPLPALKILSIQSNRLSSIPSLSHLPQLEELHISHNKLTRISGLESNTQLRVLDVTANPIEHLEGLKHLEHLEELWASETLICDFREVERELRELGELQTVYFEGSPLQKRNLTLYRNKIRLALPQVRQIDATYVRV
ncbi:protein phosphatase 1 regulatory subunit 7 [Sporormia fimetaria CBS 119925]|uniref:Protein phosphatase 1 regulatory subunit 7 n=1 Tax=Sporormia fimetaria CBS 119925 TaxID=1340428 RepID=A0A6A6VN08_9PLEO|nr:protein phosphatase 1 regulatory subunit 7 [Sporormia fimetaria CBS 119925]